METKPTSIHKVDYRIPRANVSLPGRQNRASDGIIHVTPGMTEPFEFHFGNQDGVPLNLVPFTIKFVVWQIKNLDRNIDSFHESDIIFSKTTTVTDPHTGSVILLLESTDTIQLARFGERSLRWNLFMVNQDGQVFPATVTNTGQRFGTIRLDQQSGIPLAEIIKSL